MIHGKISFLTILGILTLCTFAFGQGAAFRGMGAVNESMGGAATACPLDAAGVSMWNPAAMMGLQNSEISVNFGLALANSELTSTLPDGLGGQTSESETGAVPIPSVAIVKRDQCSRWATGFSFGAVGGSRTNYSSAAITENPILSNSQYGYGNLNSNIQVLQLAPNVAYAVTDKLSLSAGLTVNMAEMNCDPLFLVEGYAQPSDALVGSGGRWIWGAGFQLGAYYDTMMGWKFGLCYKSQGWMEDFRMKCTEADGSHSIHKVSLDYPAILSLGMSYDAIPTWVFAADFRYFWYEDAEYDKLGWENIFSIHLGVQKQLTDRFSVRAGYTYNENPIQESFARENIACPLLPSHAVFCGFSHQLFENMKVSLTYGHIFEESVTGPYFGSKNAAYGGTVTTSARADIVTAGVSMNF